MRYHKKKLLGYWLINYVIILLIILEDSIENFKLFVSKFKLLYRTNREDSFDYYVENSVGDSVKNRSRSFRKLNISFYRKLWIL